MIIDHNTREQSPPPRDPSFDENETKGDDSLRAPRSWMQDDVQQRAIRRQACRRLSALLGRAHDYVNSTEYGRRAQDYLLVKPRQAPRRIGIFIAAAVFMLLLLLYMLKPVTRHQSHKIPLISGGSSFSKPEGVKVYGIVFYGRRTTVEILDCYLHRNLAANGGWLDAVHFVINTDDQDDLAWIEKRVKKVRDYKIIPLDEAPGHDYEKLWRRAVQPGHLYVKFDDDLVWMSDTAVEEAVTTLIKHPEAFIVLANLVNSAALGWVHHHQGAIHSYLPELRPPEAPNRSSYGPKAWRASALPSHPPVDDYTPDSPPFPDTEKDFEGSRAAIGDIGGPPYANHRWLPLRDSGTLLPLTPIWRTDYHPNGENWKGWQLGAQQHYSLLQNLENNDLSAYHFGDKDGIWNMRYLHANINFMAVWADDILDNLPFDVPEDDEAHFSIHLPRKLKRQTYIQTRAIASHFSFGPQLEMYDTDLLSRYRAYANEKVCGRRNQIPIPKTTGG